MKFIDKCRLQTKQGIEKNKKKEYKKALNEIKFNAKNGEYSMKFILSCFYENKDEIYIYIMDKLKRDGFKVEIEKYGCEMSHTRMVISWER